MSRTVPPPLDWHRDLPDSRDYTPDHPHVQQMLGRLPEPRSSRPEKPGSVDLREYVPSLSDPGPAHSSAAQACTALVACFQRRAHGTTIRGSTLFLHQMTQKLLRGRGDAGGELRTTLKALVRFGLPPARYWPCDATHFGREPEPFLYCFGEPFRSIRYVRLDARNSTGEETLAIVKSFLAAGFPSVFGFTVPSSLSGDPDVPYRPTFDSPAGGHAAMAVGYDDRRLRATKGALLIRTFFTPPVGDQGYVWLPYAYVQQQLAVDFWTLLKPAWLGSGEFQRPSGLALQNRRAQKHKD